MGGTGSGMFLDLAYTVRGLLRRMGYGRPEVIGLLLAPLISLRASRQGNAGLQNADCRVQIEEKKNQSAGLQSAISNPQSAISKNPIPLGNSCAALAELYHFARPDTTFTARYQDKEPALTDPEPPFARTVLLGLPEATQVHASAEVIGMAARFLLSDSCVGLDRLAAAGRSGLPAPPPPRRGQYFETFGTYRLGFPQRRIVQQLASLSLQKIVQRWMSKDARPLGESVRAWVEEQWRGHELAAEHFIGRVQQACEKRLGQAPELAFSAALSPLLKELGEADTPGPRPGEQPGPRRGSAPKPKRVLTPEDVAEVLAGYQGLLGRPEEFEESTPPGGEAPPPAPLPEALREAAAAIAAEWSQKLAELPVRLIEKPTFRLAGAEEAVRRVVASIEKVLSVHEPLARELAERAKGAYARLMTLLAQSNDPRSWPRRGMATPQDVINLLRDYPKCRYQALVLQQVLSVYVSLRGHLTDTLREINFCRVRLGDLASSLSVARAPSAAANNGQRTPDRDYAVEVEGPGKFVFRQGCKDLAQAVGEGEAALGPDALLELDGRIQKVIRKQFGSLVQVCLAPANVTRNVARAMSAAGEAFVAERLAKADVARLFLDQHSTQDAAVDELIALYEEAVPEPSRTATARAVAAQAEVTVLLTPAGPAGDNVRELAESALADTSLITAAGGDDLLIYREWSNLALTDLENLGPVGQEAYRQLLATDNFPPHSRLDIDFELPS